MRRGPSAARPFRGRQAGAASVPAGRLDGPRGNGLGQGGGGHAARRAARFRRELEHGARNAAVPAHPVHLLVYVLVNGFIVIIWAMTSSHGFFWPIFPILGWGIGLVLNAWDVFRRGGFTEEQISKEVRHLQGVR